MSPKLSGIFGFYRHEWVINTEIYKNKINLFIYKHRLNHTFFLDLESPGFKLRLLKIILNITCTNSDWL